MVKKYDFTTALKLALIQSQIAPLILAFDFQKNVNQIVGDSLLLS